MRKIKKFFCIMLCAVMLVNFSGLQVKAAGIITRPLYIENCSVNAYLSFANDEATCVVSVRGSSSVSKISGTISLYDETTGRNVDSWYVNHSGYVYSTVKVAAVETGHKYTLSFRGTAYNTNGVGETISATVTKNN